MSMASNYNSRPRAPEIMVDGGNAHLVRERESVDAMLSLEHRLP
jgi:diaminopimelate decarboxylase